MISIKGRREIELMKEAGRLTAETLGATRKIICPGITTMEIDIFVDNFIRSRGGIPSFKNYNGFPASVCTSVNDVVVHGVPGDEKLQNGDIISIDVGAMIGGFHGDAARTFGVGEISDEAKKLIEVTKRCFFEGISFCKPGNRIGDIGNAVQSYAEGNGFGVVRALVGHGIGTKMHEVPDVPNFGRPGKGVRIQAGMALAIEPMINAGTGEVFVADDGWTVKTMDKKLSAHYENTVAVTEEGVIILTPEDD